MDIQGKLLVVMDQPYLVISIFNLIQRQIEVAEEVQQQQCNDNLKIHLLLYKILELDLIQINKDYKLIKRYGEQHQFNLSHPQKKKQKNHIMNLLII